MNRYFYSLRFILSVTAFLLVQVVFGQFTQSVYSKYGLGEILTPGFAQHLGMGGLTVAVPMTTARADINPHNPAAYANIRMTVFDGGISAFSIALKDQLGINRNGSGMHFNHFAVAIPVTKRSAFSFGFLPYSASGSFESTNYLVGSNTVNYVNEGNGTISKIYVGYGHQFGRLNIGANVNYLTGIIERKSALQYQDGSALSASLSDKQFFDGVQAQLGLQYRWVFTKHTGLVLGYTTELPVALRLKRTQTLSRYFQAASGGTTPLALDTAQTIHDPERSLNLPVMHRFGITWQQKRWLAGLEASLSDFSVLKLPNAVTSLGTQYTLGLGGQWTPDEDAKNYFKQMTYRAGFRYEQSPIQIGSNIISTAVLSAGVSLPLYNTSGFFLSRMNISAEWGQRGTNQDGLVKENFWQLKLGFSVYEQWFVRSKYD